ncbi:hypothetical protein E4U17_006007 [Claviceps sp. LM77 group G4]|nr:hypothetical protein E4U17_006007 [Claviceps sp. LM77 group G4]
MSPIASSYPSEVSIDYSTRYSWLLQTTTAASIQFHVFGDVFGPRLGHGFVVQDICKSREYLVEYSIDSGDGQPDAIGDIAVRCMMSINMDEDHELLPNCIVFAVLDAAGILGPF